MVGGAPIHVHMHVHACTCIHGKHGNFMQMAVPIEFGEIPGIPYDVIRVCVCMHVHMGGVHSHHPPPPSNRRGTPRIIQNSIALELI